MKEKKPIKISLTSAIMIVLIIVLVIAGIAYYLFINKPIPEKIISSNP